MTYNPNAGSGGKYFQFYADGSPIYGSYSDDNWIPGDAQSEAEIHTRASQIPGGTQNYSFGIDLEEWYNAGPNGSWDAFHGTAATTDGGTSGNGTGVGPSWDRVSGGGASYYTWDTACEY